MNRLCSVFFIFYVFIASLCWSHSASAAVTICFYNPETNVDNFATLKTSFDDYLAKTNEFNFQPFDDAKVFEDNIAQKKCQVYLLSSWYLETLQQQMPLKIVLMGTSKGNTSQSKALIAKKELSDLSLLKNTTIATASSEAYTRSVLEKMFKNKALVESVKLFKVQRDMDALSAIGYGQASAAICTEGNFARLTALNPNLFQQLHTLGTTEKNYLLVVAVAEKPNKKQMQAIDILQKMATNSAGGKNLSLLGLDGWVAK